MKTHSCLFCDSAEVTLIENVSAEAIILAYENIFNVHVRNIFEDSSILVELLLCRNCDLKWYEPLVPGDAKFYEKLQQHDWYYQEHKSEYDFAKNLIREGDLVLEIGCGKGMFAKLLPKNTSYHGLEFNQAAVEKAKLKGLNVGIDSIENHSIQNLGVYDVVCHFQVMEHVTDPQRFLDACVQTLKPGGLLIVAVPSEDSFISIAEDGWLNMPPHHMTRWSDNALKYAFDSFELNRIKFWHEPLADYHKNWYRSTMLNLGFKNLFGIKTSLQKDKFFSRVASKLEKTTYLGDWLAGQGAKKFPFAERGHTVCAVGYKR